MYKTTTKLSNIQIDIECTHNMPIIAAYPVYKQDSMVRPQPVRFLRNPFHLPRPEVSNHKNKKQKTNDAMHICQSETYASPFTCVSPMVFAMSTSNSNKSNLNY